MRKSLLLSLLFAVFCLVGTAQAAGPMQVAVGVAPVKYFADQIGRRHVQVMVLVPAGADPHDYEPKPSQMRALARTSVYLSTGLEFEKAWAPRLTAANRRLVFCRMDQGLRKLPMPEAEHAQPGDTDPHLWVAPPEVRQMAEKIAAAFSKADPANARNYAANLRDFEKRVDSLDAEFRRLFAGVPAGHRSFMVFHPAWGYFARAYGLDQMAIEFEGKEPSPRRLAATISEAKSKGVRVIFVQPQMSQRSARTIAKAVGARVVVADPLAPDWFANLRSVARGFRAALQ